MTNPGLSFENSARSAWWNLPADVSIQDGCVVAPVDQEWRPVGPQPGMLAEFIQLSEGNDEQIAAYARKHGLIYVCSEHLLPASHWIWSGGTRAGGAIDQRM
ncbi:MAG: hypothetical protein M3P30_11580 [Chloroflexota bacterium]|nr:hypothetical protein [Chloroflexota bacterium]